MGSSVRIKDIDHLRISREQPVLSLTDDEEDIPGRHSGKMRGERDWVRTKNVLIMSDKMKTEHKIKRGL